MTSVDKAKKAFDYISAIIASIQTRQIPFNLNYHVAPIDNKSML